MYMSLPIGACDTQKHYSRLERTIPKSTTPKQSKQHTKTPLPIKTNNTLKRVENSVHNGNGALAVLAVHPHLGSTEKSKATYPFKPIAHSYGIWEPMVRSVSSLGSTSLEVTPHTNADFLASSMDTLNTFPPVSSPNSELPFNHSDFGPFDTMQVRSGCIPGNACSTRQYTRDPG